MTNSLGLMSGQITAAENEIDALDTLDELSCTATQVVVNDGGWRCADPVLNRSLTGVLNYTLETTGDVGYSTSLAIGADGNPVISHRDYTNGDLELYVCDDATCASGTNQTLATVDDAGYYTSVAIGVDGNPVISHQDATNGVLVLYVCDDPACASGTNQTLLTDGSVGRYSSVAIGVDGNPVISHQDQTNADLQLAVPGFAVTGLVFE